MNEESAMVSLFWFGTVLVSLYVTTTFLSPASQQMIFWYEIPT